MADYKCKRCGVITTIRKERNVLPKKWMAVICKDYDTRMYLVKGDKRVKRSIVKNQG